MKKLKRLLLCIIIILPSTRTCESEKEKNKTPTPWQLKHVLTKPRKCAPGESSEYGTINDSSHKSKEGYTNWYEDFDSKKARRSQK